MDAAQTEQMNRAEAYDRSQDTPINPSDTPVFGEIVRRRFGRRAFLGGGLAAAALAAAGPALLAGSRRAAAAALPAFVFDEIAHGVDETHHVAPGYDADILIRWGDPVMPGAPPFDPLKQTASAQALQFGYNNDFVGFLPLPQNAPAGERSARGLLFVNHEYTNEEVMFPGLPPVAKGEDPLARMTADHVGIEMAAHGASIVEVMRDGAGKWKVVPDGQLNRRITTADTEMTIAGPAAGHERMRTKADPNGTLAVGTLNNCAGGVTPWGTVLTAEENFHGYFVASVKAPASGDKKADYLAGNPEARNHKRYGVPGLWYAWGRFHDRFDIDKEPNEPNRFGWLVEVDPYDPESRPVKRTALGRFKHEGAGAVIAADGRVVVYSGDDERFEYLYKFVSEGRFDPKDRKANMSLLDRGTLYVARFEADGSVAWLPLVFGEGKLTAENGFASQADVVIEARRAADLLGATPMDRPEDVEVNPITGRVYVMLTNNTRRKPEQVDGPNPRADNVFGQVLEMVPANGDHAAATSRWELLVRCGDPAAGAVGAMWNPATSSNGWFASPDNCAIDARGRLWVTTDQGSAWPKSGTADGMWGLATDGEGRGTGRMFFRVPVGAELCGPCFTPDDETLFLAVQHPATDGVAHYAPFGRNSTFEDPATRWPDFQSGMPPRPSIVVVTKTGGGKVGG